MVLGTSNVARKLQMNLTIVEDDYDIDLGEMNDEIGATVYIQDPSLSEGETGGEEGGRDLLKDASLQEEELEDSEFSKDTGLNVTLEENIVTEVEYVNGVHQAEIELESVDADKNKNLVEDASQPLHELIPNVPQKYVPTTGMEFETEKSAYEFYNLYARLGGFDTKWSTFKKNKGEVCYRWFVCRNEGMKKSKVNAKNSYASRKCGCKAKMVILKRKPLGDWVVKNIQYAHNHSLHSPSKINMYRSSKRLSTPQKETLNVILSSGFQPSEAMRLLSKDYGDIENVPFTLQQVYAYQKTVAKRYQGMDCQLTLDYFIKKKEENPDFYFAIQVDDNAEIGNCFWIDEKAREDYHYFGDVVSFNTTYKVNKYLMSFAPFTGVNHHNQSILFGCALLVNEKTESFIWIFKEWLHAVGGRSPLSIITDQDLAMKSAIKEVFPDTIHRFCIWHIGQKVPKNLKTLYKRNSTFKSMWNKWFYNSQSIEEFELNWKHLTTSWPQLLHARFATDLWDERHMWFSLYTPNAFMAGMSTTQRSESMNSFFKKWVDKNTTLHLFVTKFEEAIARRRFVEKEVDMNMNSERPHLLTGTPMEKHLFDIFTPAIFLKTIKELLKTTSCFIQFENEVEDIKIYKGTQMLEDEHTTELRLTFDKTTQVISGCKCYLWESCGIICCHMFVIFRAENIHKLPSKYILQRWTKNVKSSSIQRLGPSHLVPNEPKSLVLRKHLFQLKSAKCLGEALKFEETFDEALVWLDELLRKIEARNAEMSGGEENVGVKVLRSTNIVEEDIFIKDRNPVQAKGSGKRLRSAYEVNMNAKMCSSCGKKGHYSTTCSFSMTSSSQIEHSDSSKTFRKCKTCGGTGHDKRNCEQFKKK